MQRMLFSSILLFGCTSSPPPYIPGGGIADDSAGETDSGSATCIYTEWTQVGEVWIDPLSCTAWGPKSNSMDWYEAVSPSEAIAGGCTSHCDDDGEGHCADVGSIDGLAGPWALPSIETLEQLALRDAPFEDPGGDLWSRTSDTNMNQLAQTVDLNQPGMSVTLDKNSGAYVRCMLNVAD